MTHHTKKEAPTDQVGASERKQTLSDDKVEFTTTPPSRQPNPISAMLATFREIKMQRERRAAALELYEQAEEHEEAAQCAARAAECAIERDQHEVADELLDDERAHVYEAMRLRRLAALTEGGVL